MTYALDAAFRRAAHDDAVKAIVLAGAGKHSRQGTISARRAATSTNRSTAHRCGTTTSTRKAANSSMRASRCTSGCAGAGATCRSRRSRWCRARASPAADARVGVRPDRRVRGCVLRRSGRADGDSGRRVFRTCIRANPRIAKEFLFLGERMPAERAYQMGMVNRVVPRERLRDATRSPRRSRRCRASATLTKQALNHVEELQGKRAAMDAAFAWHHFAHAQRTGERRPPRRLRRAQHGQLAAPAEWCEP